MSLRLRIFVLFFVLISGALSFALYTVDANIREAGQSRVFDALSVGHKVFEDKLYSELDNFVKAAKILGKEDGLREAVFDDQRSLEISLGNFLSRFESEHSADLMWLLDLDGKIVGQAGVASDGRHFQYLAALDALDNQGWSSGFIVPLNEELYQLAVVGFFIPVSAPSPSFWIVIGRELDNQFVNELSQLTNLEISIYDTQQNSIWANSRTLPSAHDFIQTIEPYPTGAGFPLLFDGQNFLGLKVLLNGSGGNPVHAILMKSSEEVQQQLQSLTTRLIVIGITALIMSLAGAAVLSRSITQPLRHLVTVAHKLGSGQVSERLPENMSGEMGTLAQAFNTMQTDIAKRTEEIQFIAFHDELTALPNRNAFVVDLDACIQVAKEHSSQLAVCIFDFDRFKDINDTLGHHSGDSVLVAFAKRLRAWCSAPIKIARLGGDEFAVLVHDVEHIDNVVDQLQALVKTPIEIECIALEIRLSMGVSFYPDHGETPNALLQKAEVAMYLAKNNIRDVVFYDKDQDHNSTQRLTLIAELNSAIESHQLALHYQPKLDLAQMKYTYVEALVRWVHPRFGFINPEEFIGYAEQTGAIRELTHWVIDTALLQRLAWQAQGLDIKVAINISAMDLTHEDFAPWVIAKLNQYDIAPQAIVLEVTESAVMRDIDLALAALHTLHDYGIKLSIDDYGTGYSSMAQLKCLPVDELKIDKSFVLGLAQGCDDLVIVKSTIELGHNMGLKIVAEGVEDQDSLDILAGLKCDLAQGFHLSRPLGADKIHQWVDDNADQLVRFNE